MIEARARRTFLALSLFLALFRFLVGFGDELVVRELPHDSNRHVAMAAAMIDGGWRQWLGPYDEMTLIREPGTALWMALVHGAGIPLPVGNRLLHVAACLVFVAALARAGLARSTALLVLAGLLFQPASFHWNVHVAAEALYAPVLLLALAGLVVASRARTSRAALPSFGCGLACAFLWILRPERPLLALLALAFLLLDARASRRTGTAWRGVTARAAVVAASIALPVVAADAAVRLANFRHYGVAVLSDLTEPGFQGAYRALLRVRPPIARSRHSVPVEARRLAYRKSEAFRSLEPHLEGGFGDRWREPRPEDGLAPDMPDGWFHFAMREAAAAEGRHRSAPEAAAFYRRIEREVDLALSTGELPERRFLLGPFNPDMALWAPRLPLSVLRVGRMLLGLAPLVADAVPGESAATRALVDRVTRRRTAGWMEVPAAIRHVVQRAVRKLYPWTAVGLALAAVVAALFRRPRVGTAEGLAPGVVVPILLVVVLSRLLLFSIIDASAFTAAGVRYMYPAVGPAWTVLAIAATAAASASRRRERRGLPIEHRPGRALSPEPTRSAR